MKEIDSKKRGEAAFRVFFAAEAWLNGFFYRGAVTCNSLPPILYEAKTLSRFKSTFKRLCC